MDVNRLLKQFEMMQDLVKQMTRGRMPKGLGGFGGQGRHEPDARLRPQEAKFFFPASQAQRSIPKLNGILFFK